jgi:hypothetical protein
MDKNKGYPLDSTDHYMLWSLVAHAAAEGGALGRLAGLHGRMAEMVKE